MTHFLIGGYGEGNWFVIEGYGGPPVLGAPRLLAALNVSPGILIAFFNEPMKQNAALTDLINYTVEPLPGYEDRPLVFTGVAAGPDRVQLSFIGGPGSYRLTVDNVIDLNEELVIDPLYKTALFIVRKPMQAPQTIVRVFDTIVGPMGLRQQTVGAQTIEDLLQQRAISQGVTAQLANIISTLGPSAVTRDTSRIPFSRIK
jgi:hypothetical protein